MKVNDFYKAIAEWLNNPKNYGIVDEETGYFYRFPAKTIIRIGTGLSQVDMHLPYASLSGHAYDESLKKAEQKASKIPHKNSEILIFPDMGTKDVPDVLTIRNLGMHKGATFCNGIPIDHNPVRLEDKDVIELGSLKYRLRFLTKL